MVLSSASALSVPPAVCWGDRRVLHYGLPVCLLCLPPQGVDWHLFGLLGCGYHLAVGLYYARPSLANQGAVSFNQGCVYVLGCCPWGPVGVHLCGCLLVIPGWIHQVLQDACPCLFVCNWMYQDGVEQGACGLQTIALKSLLQKFFYFFIFWMACHRKVQLVKRWTTFSRLKTCRHWGRRTFKSKALFLETEIAAKL